MGRGGGVGEVGPRWGAGGPEFLEVFAVALGVHAGPEPAVFVHAQLAIAGEVDERGAFEDTGFLLREVWEELALEEEVTAVDPVIGEVGFLGEFLNERPVGLEFTESRGWVDAEDGSDSLVFKMEGVFVGEVGVGEAIAVGDGESCGVGEVTGGGACDARARHGQFAGVGKRDGPVLVMVDGVHGEVIGLELDREVGVHGGVVQKIGFDDFRLIAAAQNELLESMVGIGLHDMPEDRSVSDGNHGLGSEFSFFSETGSHAAAQDEDGYAGEVVAQDGLRGIRSRNARPTSRLRVTSAESERDFSFALRSLNGLLGEVSPECARPKRPCPEARAAIDARTSYAGQ